MLRIQLYWLLIVARIEAFSCFISNRAQHYISSNTFELHWPYFTLDSSWCSPHWSIHGALPHTSRARGINNRIISSYCCHKLHTYDLISIYLRFAISFIILFPCDMLWCFEIVAFTILFIFHISCQIRCFGAFCTSGRFGTRAVDTYRESTISPFRSLLCSCIRTLKVCNWMNVMVTGSNILQMCHLKVLTLAEWRRSNLTK